MAQWGNTDTVANSVLWGTTAVNLTTNSANRSALFGNSTVGAFKNNNVGMKVAFGQFGADTTEVANSSGEGGKVTHAGWVLRKAGTGPVTAVTVAAGGKTYNNTDTISITASGTGGVVANSSGTLTTNSTGGITSVTITSGGAGYVTATVANASFVIANSTGGSTTGAGANLVATVGGRAGRVQYETLVAMGSLTSDASDDTRLPE